eukprot:Colp12_sorted_trinity150504_noHs@10584
MESGKSVPNNGTSSSEEVLEDRLSGYPLPNGTHELVSVEELCPAFMTFLNATPSDLEVMSLEALIALKSEVEMLDTAAIARAKDLAVEFEKLEAWFVQEVKVGMTAEKVEPVSAAKEISNTFASPAPAQLTRKGSRVKRQETVSESSTTRPRSLSIQSSMVDGEEELVGVESDTITTEPDDPDRTRSRPPSP